MVTVNTAFGALEVIYRPILSQYKSFPFYCCFETRVLKDINILETVQRNLPNGSLERKLTHHQRSKLRFEQLIRLRVHLPFAHFIWHHRCKTFRLFIPTFHRASRHHQ